MVGATFFYTIRFVFGSFGLLMLIVIYAYFQWKYRYWRNLNVKSTNPMFPLGDLNQVGFFKHFAVIFKEIYEQFRGERFNGLWVAYRPFLMIRDPELIRAVLVRDFSHFRSRGLYQDEIDPLTDNLFFVSGVRWRNLRAKLTPNFTSSRMRRMFDVVAEKGCKLREVYRHPADEKEVVEPKEFAVRYTHDTVASCFLGAEVNAIQDPNSIIYSLGKIVFGPSWMALIRTGLVFFVPDLATLLRAVPTPKPVSDFFINTFRDVMVFRESNGVKCPDLITLLLELKDRGYLADVDHNGNVRTEQNKGNKFGFISAVAQSFIFWIGGFEGSAASIQFALYEMCKNQPLQERARKEIKTILAKYNFKITYDGLLEMEYLGRVVDETLRKYPPVAMLNRVCNQAYKIPDSDVVIEEGIPILISVLGLHMDPEHYPDPEKFDPERFTEEQKSKRHRYTYLPFGDGPRTCIGQRFALMQIKIGLVNLLANYKFELAESTPEKPTFNGKSVIYTVAHGIPLRISNLEKEL